MDNDLSAKPFLRWAGSKRKLLPLLSSFWKDDTRRYFEPFAGSAQLFYFINPKRAILADLNEKLIGTYQSVKENPKAVHSILQKLPVSKESYYKIREEQSADLLPFEQAARFIYLNRFCFNGLYRTNQLGKFNVPYSGYKTGDLPSIEQLKLVSKVLKDVKLITGDFENVVLRNVTPHDFVYLDPPYAIKNTRIFNQYDPNSFGLEDIERLLVLLTHIDGCGAKFLLSYAYDPFIKKIFSHWKVRTVDIQRNISGFNKHRRISKELLVTNIKLTK